MTDLDRAIEVVERHRATALSLWHKLHSDILEGKHAACEAILHDLRALKEGKG